MTLDDAILKDILAKAQALDGRAPRIREPSYPAWQAKVRQFRRATEAHVVIALVEEVQRSRGNLFTPEQVGAIAGGTAADVIARAQEGARKYVRTAVETLERLSERLGYERGSRHVNAPESWYHAELDVLSSIVGEGLAKLRGEEGKAT